MTIEKRYELRGLNLKKSEITKPTGYATDVQNVELDSKRQIIKRFGFDSVVDVTGIGVIDSNEYVKGSELLMLSPSSLRKLSSDGLSIETINSGGATPIVGWSEQVNFDEYNGVVYWSDPSGNNYPWKYDGKMTYRAGVPEPTVTNTPSAGFKYYRIYLKVYDSQGNITSGDYVQVGPYVDNATFTFSQPSDGFYSKYGSVNGLQTVRSIYLTMNVLSGHNYVAGDWVLGRKLPNGDLTSILIDSVTATTITFNTASIGSDEFIFNDAGPVCYRTEIVFAKSDNASYGYEIFHKSNEMNRVLAPSVFATVTLSPTIPLEDEYDTTVLKGLPPKCKYLAVYNNTMVMANRSDLSVFIEEAETKEPNTYFWSDTGVGSTVETFPPFNKEVLGKTSEGEISGIFAATDNMVMMKERQIYYINGILIGRNFRSRSALTNGVGCVSHKSIQEIEGGCIFMSARGVYQATYGQKPVEFSDLIEPLFTEDTTGLDLTKANTVNDSKNEKLLMFIPATLESDDITLVYDYYYREWFKHKNILSRNGMTFFGSDMYHIDSTDLYKRSLSYNDNGSAITAFWKSIWEDLGEPTIVKKFIRFIAISLSSLSWVLNVKTQRDWKDVDHTDQDISFNSTIYTDDSVVDMSQNKSMRFEIGNDVINEGMLVTGYEFEYEYTQTRPKGES